jgi:hypothetical protein
MSSESAEDPELRRLLSAADEYAALPPAAWLLKRKPAARELGVPVGGLDKLVDDARKASAAAKVEAENAEAAEASVAAEQQRSEWVEPSERFAYLYEDAKEILLADDILDLVKEALKAEGYAGDTAPAQRSFVALTSRLLSKPLNIHRQAPPAVGKNFSHDAVLPYFPPSAYYKISASSPHSFIYLERSLEHVMIIIGEIDSIPEEGPAASAIRSIIDEARMTYDTVERDAKGKNVTRHITKKGPTGILSTGVEPFGEQMASRVLTDHLRDDAEQTQLILMAQARIANGEFVPDFDARAKFVACQLWLETKGERRVVIPYGPVLSQLVPAQAVRVRRDFPRLLTVIQTLALLHQCRRERDSEGRIIASWHDYESARTLLDEVIDIQMTDSVSKTMLETVEAIKPEETVSLPTLAARLKLTKSPTHDRVKKAMAVGCYIVNAEEREGFPMQLQRGTPLPPPQTALPTLNALKLACERDFADLNGRPEIKPEAF